MKGDIQITKEIDNFNLKLIEGPPYPPSVIARILGVWVAQDSHDLLWSEYKPDYVQGIWVINGKSGFLPDNLIAWPEGLAWNERVAGPTD